MMNRIRFFIFPALLLVPLLVGAPALASSVRGVQTLQPSARTPSPMGSSASNSSFWVTMYRSHSWGSTTAHYNIGWHVFCALKHTASQNNDPDAEGDVHPNWGQGTRTASTSGATLYDWEYDVSAGWWGWWSGDIWEPTIYCLSAN